MTPAVAGWQEVARVRVRVRGVVQGVGFRPFVWRLARELGLDGWVRNDAEGVEIDATGGRAQVTRFLGRLREGAPARARVESVEATALAIEPVGGGFRGFHIVASGAGARSSTAIGPDVAVCSECLAELFAPGDRRHRYPFINCTQCGPRFTITRRLPYDRPQTSMAPFALCAACQREYTDPADRRFHAEPNACAACGPRLRFADRAGNAIAVEDPIAAALAFIGRGQVLAIKGLGGFHLVCDARNGEAVARVRARKLREARPFAVMLGGTRSVAALAEMSLAEETLLGSPERPIVLLRKRPGCDLHLPGVAPGMAWLGAMLPYTPIHYLLFHDARGRPSGTAWLDEEHPLALVMTSANPSGEPLVIGDAEASARLEGIADAFLLHDREILLRCDDSVMRLDGEHPVFVRRARGHTPRAIALAASGPPVLAVGASLKNTVCVTRDAQAFLTPHIGDLDNAATCAALEEAAAHLSAILEVTPALVAHDRHPDFFSTRFAVELAAHLGVPAVAVQHHHAHIAAVCAEHGFTGRVLGVALDGVGLGDNDAAWGGELLRVDGARWQRLGHLRELPLPGGDRAAREPWRMAASALWALGRGGEIGSRFSRQKAAAQLAEVIARGVNCPLTSSTGRLFDAAASLLGLREVARFEGQAAMELEGLAAAHGTVEPLDGAWSIDDGVLDLLRLLDHLAGETDAARGAARFHATLAAALAEWVTTAARAHDIDTVALGGGCFLNHVLGGGLVRRLESEGLRVLAARAVPPNDGGIALGQAWVALRTLP